MKKKQYNNISGQLDSIYHVLEEIRSELFYLKEDKSTPINNKSELKEIIKLLKELKKTIV